MRAIDIFREHKESLVRQWVENVFASYPLDTKGFLRTQEDPFLNPVGEMTHTVLDVLYDAVTGEHLIKGKAEAALERFVKLRAVQDFPPSQALGILYAFKSILRTALLEICRKEGLLEDLLEAESRLDTLALLAFDLYVKDRETLAEQRIREIRMQHAQLVRWAQRMDGSPFSESDTSKL